jgi:hypothetical protein
MEIQPPFTSIVHPKLILAAAVFFACCGNFPRQASGSRISHRSRFHPKAPEGWRTPRRFARFACHRQTLAFWTAVALHRFAPDDAAPERSFDLFG